MVQIVIFGASAQEVLMKTSVLAVALVAVAISFVLFGFNVAWAITDLTSVKIGWVRWAPYISRVDQSTATTLVFLLTSWRLLIGVIQLRRARRGAVALDV